jgi:diguanylate cyclase (GGDEF)-like protein/PAS domain S-box-containing protein
VAVVAGSDFLEPTPPRLSERAGSLSAPGRFVLVVWPVRHLSGSASAALPWVLLVGGLVATLLVAYLLELSERHRQRILGALHQVEERNLALDTALVIQQRTEARFSAMVRSSSDLTTVVSGEGTIRYQSPSAVLALGVDPDSLLGRDYVSLIHPEDRPLWKQALTRVETRAGAEVAAEWRLQSSDGTFVSLDTRVTNLLDDPSVSGVVLNSRDVSEHKRLEDELRHQAFHDSLTGLANRALFEDRLDNALARISRTKETLAVLFLDLDDFKAINDGRGHNIGDELLRTVSNRFAGALRAGDTLARIGGDEFAVLVEGFDDSGGVRTAERLLASLQTAILLGSTEAVVGVSIGVASTNGLRSAQELLRDADIAMYAAKSAGKGRIEVFNVGLHGEVVNRLQLEVDLRQALENDQMLVYYQPLVDISTHTVVGLEALMRWMHPERGIVGPTEFISIAESTGLIVTLGRWLIRHACLDSVSIRQSADRSDLQLSVNISARQLDDPLLVKCVHDALMESGLPPASLTLEITESVFISDADRSLNVLEQLRSIGVKLSIDDFGTGYSSLGYLQQLPVDELKIDRTFIVAAADSSESRALVRTIVDLARDFGLRTVAEGIETVGQLEGARDAGCEYAQGFLFASPATVADIISQLENDHALKRRRAQEAGSFR